MEMQSHSACSLDRGGACTRGEPYHLQERQCLLNPLVQRVVGVQPIAPQVIGAASNDYYLQCVILIQLKDSAPFSFLEVPLEDSIANLNHLLSILIRAGRKIFFVLCAYCLEKYYW